MPIIRGSIIAPASDDRLLATTVRRLYTAPRKEEIARAHSLEGRLSRRRHTVQRRSVARVAADSLGTVSVDRFSVHPGVAMGARQVAGLKALTGRSLEEWIDLVRVDGPADENQRVSWLKSEHKLGTNYAGLLVEAAAGRGRERWDPDAYLAAAPTYVAAMFSGKKAHLEPVYRQILSIGLALGDDVRVSPTTTFVPLYRNRVFAQLKPTTQTRIDLGLALGDTETAGRLIDTGGLAKGDRITHRIALHEPGDIDAEVVRWLTAAYRRDAQDPK